MKKLLTSFGLVILMMITFNGFSQTAISDVSHTADPSAVLDVYSNSLGMLAPRLATDPASPATGLFYYNTGSNAFKYFDGTAWQRIDIVPKTPATKARVFQSISNSTGTGGQLIPASIWVPVIHDMITFDTKNEMTTGDHTVPIESYFQAFDSGYYQVNARVDFILYDVQQGEPINNPTPDGYVSIAIFIKKANGNAYYMYAQGNKLQGADNNAGGDTYLKNNLAPNVSDILYLEKDDRVKIFVWQNLHPTGGTIPLRITEQNGAGGPDTQVYFSIHKIQ